MRYHEVVPIAIEQLQADDWFASAGIPIHQEILTLDHGDSETAQADYDNDLGTLGVVVVMDLAASAYATDTKSSGKVLLTVRLQVRIVENPAVQRAAGGLGLSMPAVIENVAAALLGAADRSHIDRLSAPEKGLFIEPPTRLRDSYIQYPINFDARVTMGNHLPPAE